MRGPMWWTFWAFLLVSLPLTEARAGYVTAVLGTIGTDQIFNPPGNSNAPSSITGSGNGSMLSASASVGSVGVSTSSSSTGLIGGGASASATYSSFGPEGLDSRGNVITDSNGIPVRIPVMYFAHLSGNVNLTLDPNIPGAVAGAGAAFSITTDTGGVSNNFQMVKTQQDVLVIGGQGLGDLSTGQPTLSQNWAVPGTVNDPVFSFFSLFVQSNSTASSQGASAVVDFGHTLKLDRITTTADPALDLAFVRFSPTDIMPVEQDEPLLTPEPQSFILLGIGLAGAGVQAWRRRRR